MISREEWQTEDVFHGEIKSQWVNSSGFLSGQENDLRLPTKAPDSCFSRGNHNTAVSTEFRAVRDKGIDPGVYREYTQELKFTPKSLPIFNQLPLSVKSTFITPSILQLFLSDMFPHNAFIYGFHWSANRW